MEVKSRRGRPRAGEVCKPPRSLQRRRQGEKPGENEGSRGNKGVVARYFEAVSASDPTRVLDVLSNDVSLIVPGDWALAGTYHGDAIVEVIEAPNSAKSRHFWLGK